MISAGMTGSRNGMTKAQKVEFRKLLAQLEVGTLHHGDCVGADEQAAAIAQELGILTIAHPPTNEKLRAFHESDIVLESKPHLVRNRDIVDSSSTVFAFPKEMKEVLRSGTWSTVRYARGSGKAIVIYKDGTIGP